MNFEDGGIAFILILLYVVMPGESNYITEPYSAETLCNTAKAIKLSSHKDYSAILKATNNNEYYGNGNCTIKIVPVSGFGVIAHVRKMNLRHYFHCQDYVTITYTGGSTERICSEEGKVVKTTPYYLKGSMYITFYRDYNAFPIQDHNFEIVFTQYNYGPCFGNDFKCKYGHCIKNGLRCDHKNNCGDNSDENCDSTFKTGTVIALTIGAAALIAIGIAIIIVKKRNSSMKLRALNQALIFQHSFQNYGAPRSTGYQPVSRDYSPVETVYTPKITVYPKQDNNSYLQAGNSYSQHTELPPQYSTECDQLNEYPIKT